MVEQTPKKEPLPLLGARTPRGSVPDEGGVTGFIVDSVQDALRAADVGAGLSRQTQSSAIFIRPPAREVDSAIAAPEPGLSTLVTSTLARRPGR
jgi:hypothetical protein